MDAILDPATGRAILLPAAQAALIERRARFRSLVELASDGHWEQDENYRFVAHTGTAIGNEATGAESILGKTLWELSFDNGSEVDWPTHRRQLEWRAVFRNMELSCLDSAGRLRRISLSGEPIFTTDAQFTGYRGITREITEREQPTTAAPGSDGFARAALDALATQVCVLDTQGLIISTNAAWRAFAAAYAESGPALAENDNYLAACASAVGHEGVDAVAMAAGLRQVIAGERDAFRYERAYGAPHAGRWFMAAVTRLRGAGAARATVAYADITQIKQAQRLHKLECAVARCLASTDDTAVSVQSVIQAVCVTQGWDCGRFFRLDTAAGVLTAGESWAVADVAVEEFLAKSRGIEVRAGRRVGGPRLRVR